MFRLNFCKLTPSCQVSTWDHLACRLFFDQKSYCTSLTFNVTVLIQRDDFVLKLGERFFFFLLLLLSFFKSDRTEREADEEESATTASVLARQTVCVTVRRSVLQRRDLSILQVYSFPSLFATLHAGHVW